MLRSGETGGHHLPDSALDRETSGAAGGASLAKAEGERLAILRPAEIPASSFFASSPDDKLRELTLLTEEGFRSQLKTGRRGRGRPRLSFRHPVFILLE